MRPEKDVNVNMDKGELEILISDVQLLNIAVDLPFKVFILFIKSSAVKLTEEVRLKNRYLDIRRREIKEILKIRSKISHSFHNYFNENNFIEVETPILGHTSPEVRLTL